MSSTESGYTITEILIVLAVGGTIIGMIFGPFDSLYRSSFAGLRAIIQAADTRAALRQIEPEITQSVRFLATNNNTDNSTTPSTAWDWKGTPAANANSRVLITENYGTSPAEETGATPRKLVMNAPACGTHQTFNYVYFVTAGALYRRTLKNNSYPSACEGLSIAQKRTCAASLSNPSYCQGSDAKIVDGVIYFHVDYYQSPGAAQPLNTNNGTSDKTLYTDDTTPQQASSVVITITVRSGTGNNIVDMTSRMRITKVNGVSV